MIPKKEDNPKGLHQRYVVRKVVGVKDLGYTNYRLITKAVDRDAEYFVMRLDSGGKDPKHINACKWRRKK